MSGIKATVVVTNAMNEVLCMLYQSEDGTYTIVQPTDNSLNVHVYTDTEPMFNEPTDATNGRMKLLQNTCLFKMN